METTAALRDSIGSYWTKVLHFGILAIALIYLINYLAAQILSPFVTKFIIISKMWFMFHKNKYRVSRKYLHVNEINISNIELNNYLLLV